MNETIISCKDCINRDMDDWCIERMIFVDNTMGCRDWIKKIYTIDKDCSKCKYNDLECNNQCLE